MDQEQRDTVETGAEGAGAVVEPRFDVEKVRQLKSRLEAQQHLPLAIAGGAVAAVVGAGVWAGVTILTHYQIGWIAVGVGFLVGFAVRQLGRGVTKPFGIVGAVWSFVGCMLGNLMSVSWFLAAQEGGGYGQILLTVLAHPPLAFELLKVTFSPMDVLFYAIAVYEGYRFSFRKMDPGQIEAMMADASRS